MNHVTQRKNAPHGSTSDVTCYMLHATCSRGFTLIEIIVAIALFSVVMLIATGALLSIVNANKKARAIQSSLNNVQFALDSMSRTMRVGTAYHCDVGVTPLTNPRDCALANGVTSFAFEQSGGDPANPNDQVVYRLSAGRIERSLLAGAAGSYVAVTAPEVTINNLRFYVDGSTAGDSEQPQIIIVIDGTTGTGNAATRFAVQSMVAQRVVDF